jgi:hypothetical protein
MSGEDQNIEPPAPTPMMWAFQGSEFNGNIGDEVVRMAVSSGYLSGGNIAVYGAARESGSSLRFGGKFSCAAAQGGLWVPPVFMATPTSDMKYLSFWVKGSVDNRGLLIMFNDLTGANALSTSLNLQNPAIALEGLIENGTITSFKDAASGQTGGGSNSLGATPDNWLAAERTLTTNDQWVKIKIDMTGYNIAGKVMQVRAGRAAGTSGQAGTVFDFHIDDVRYEGDPPPPGQGSGSNTEEIPKGMFYIDVDNPNLSYSDVENLKLSLGAQICAYFKVVLGYVDALDNFIEYSNGVIH